MLSLKLSKILANSQTSLRDRAPDRRKTSTESLPCAPYATTAVTVTARAINIKNWPLPTEAGVTNDRWRRTASGVGGGTERNARETKSFRHRCRTTAARLTRPYCQLSTDRVTLRKLRCIITYGLGRRSADVHNAHITCTSYSGYHHLGKVKPWKLDQSNGHVWYLGPRGRPLVNRLV